MGIAERKQKEKKELKRKILNAARELFSTEGFNNVSMRNIALKIEYSPTTIYNYFANKSEILQHLIQDHYINILEKGEELQADSAQPVESRIKAYLNMYVNEHLSNPEHLRLLAGQYTDFNPGPVENLKGFRGYQLMKQFVRMGVEEGLFKDQDFDSAAQFLWSTVFGLSSLLVLRPSFPWQENIVESTLNYAVNSLK